LMTALDHMDLVEGEAHVALATVLHELLRDVKTPRA